MLDNGDADNSFAGLMTAEKYYHKLSKYPPFKCGDKYLDALLDGGFRMGLVHLLIGPRKENSKILLKAAVRSFLPRTERGLNAQKVVYIDGNNRFNPYCLSQFALSLNLNPKLILSKIYIARAFNWSQMVELAQVKLKEIDGIDLVLIDGLTSMFTVKNGKKESLEQKTFKDLKNAINGIKKSIEKSEPIVIISAPKHPDSLYKPVGGKILTHFGCVIIDILQKERMTEYILEQHPFIKRKKVIKWNTISEEIMAKYTKWIADDYELPHEKSKKEDEEKTTSKKSACFGKKDKKDKDNWQKVIQKTPNMGFLKELKNIQLKYKRTKTNKKVQQDKRKNLTLDYYIKNK
ncbi:MAG: hypothetical protein GF364_08310 [Candidatus Lokiarchaeota archaeon]|nr:hypothetical protein [Candidatus Lokiarchaeota archaeon]